MNVFVRVVNLTLKVVRLTVLLLLYFRLGVSDL